MIKMALLNGLKTPQDLPFPGIDSSNVDFFYFKVPKPNKTLPSGLCSQRGKGSHKAQKTIYKHWDFNESAVLPLNTINTCSRIELFYKK